MVSILFIVILSFGIFSNIVGVLVFFNISNCLLSTLNGRFVMPQIDWILIKCVLYGCVMSPTLGIYWVDFGFIKNYK